MMTDPRIMTDQELGWAEKYHTAVRTPVPATEHLLYVREVRRLRAWAGLWKALAKKLFLEIGEVYMQEESNYGRSPHTPQWIIDRMDWARRKLYPHLYKKDK